MTDFGIVMIAANRMTILSAQGRLRAARRSLQTAQTFVSVTCSCVIVVMLILWLLPIPVDMAQESRWALFALVAALLVGQVGGLAEAVFRATSRFATGVTLSSTSRLLEWCGYIIGLLCGGSFVTVALGGLGGRLITCTFMIVLASVVQKDYRFGFRSASRKELRSLFRPAAGYVAYTGASALSIQGMTILAGLILGPASVVIFNTYRTISRTAVQFTSALSHSVWPEFSRTYGLGTVGELRSLYRKTMLGGTVLTVSLSVCTWFLSPVFLSIWTHGRVEYEPLLMAIFLAYATVAGIGHTPRVLLLATNNNGPLAAWGLVVAVLTIFSGVLLTSSLDVVGLAVAMLTCEFVFLIVIGFLSAKLLTTVSNSESVYAS